MSAHSVGYFVGSLSRQSINRKLASALTRLAPSELSFSEITYSDLPPYNHDCDGICPQIARDFHASTAAVRAVLFITPDYNRSLPGALKNAIDWASRPYGANAFSQKPSAVIGASIGAIGTA